MYDRIRLVRTLLSFGADMEKPSVFGFTALHLLAFRLTPINVGEYELEPGLLRNSKAVSLFGETPFDCLDPTFKSNLMKTGPRHILGVPRTPQSPVSYVGIYTNYFREFLGSI